MARHFLDRDVTISCWDRDASPRLTIAPGDEVEFAMRDASDGQVTPDMTGAQFAQIERERIHGLTGPVEIAGAEEGDRLVVTILEYRHEGWAWTSLVPGLGLLPDDFPDPFLFHWKLEGTQTKSFPGVTLDLHPFCGIMGVQRQETGTFRTRPPGSFGGNMDVKQLLAGARLSLPVAVPGAGFCCGDAHAAQGDGEVCINGMEAPMSVVARFALEKGTAPRGPELVAPPALFPPRYATRDWQVFVESAENPLEACQAVVRRAIDWLTKRLSVSAAMAYVLCSVVLDLKVSQLVNQPVVTISGFLPLAIFDDN